MSDAAMRCNGEGGVCHYFHAHCLQQWIRSARQSRQASCPVCRGSLQFNGARLDQFLQGSASAGLNEEERSFFQEISEGLKGKNEWGDMSKLEKAAYAGGIFAAGCYGFAVGYHSADAVVCHRSRWSTTNLLMREFLPQQHQVAESVGWFLGLLGRLVREHMLQKEEERRRRERRS